MGKKFTLKCHLVFCVKYRKKLLSKPHIAQTVKDSILSNQTPDFKIQVMEVDKDHIHLLVDYSPNVSVSQIVRLLKQVTTAKVWFTYSNELRKHFWKNHIFWSSGYFACSTGDASTETIAKYIAEQG
jgi:putative transposase